MVGERQASALLWRHVILVILMIEAVPVAGRHLPGFWVECVVSVLKATSARNYILAAKDSGIPCIRQG